VKAPQNVESVPRKRGKVSEVWKACHGGVARFPRCGKRATEAWQGFGSVESVPRKRGKVSEVWKACHGSVARFRKCGKRATEVWQGFQDVESVPRKRGKVSVSVESVPRSRDWQLQTSTCNLPSGEDTLWAIHRQCRPQHYNEKSDSNHKALSFCEDMILIRLQGHGGAQLYARVLDYVGHGKSRIIHRDLDVHLLG